VHRLLEEAYADAKKLLEQHIDILKALGEALYERETLDAREVNEIIRAVGGPDLIPPDPAPRIPDAKKMEAGSGATSAASEKPAAGEAPDAVPPGGIVPDTA